MQPGDRVKSIIYPYSQYEIVSLLDNGMVVVKHRFFDSLEKPVSPMILIKDKEESEDD